jgi:hypothetical protein
LAKDVLIALIKFLIAEKIPVAQERKMFEISPKQPRQRREQRCSANPTLQPILSLTFFQAPLLQQTHQVRKTKRTNPPKASPATSPSDIAETAAAVMFGAEADSGAKLLFATEGVCRSDCASWVQV